MRIARQGYRHVGIGLGAAAVGFAIGGWALPLAGLALVFTAFSAYFFRDPERPLPTDPSKFYSPGDGRVLSVAEEKPGEGVTVRIFLSVFNVHIQRFPVSGTVTEVRRQPGSFLAAMKPAAIHNERNVVGIRPEGGKPVVWVEQIAGLVARRIETWPKPGDTLKAGERYGIIYFGSQAALRLPPGCTPLVKPGDVVVGAVTPVAAWA